jgi:hypothetical protein
MPTTESLKAYIIKTVCLDVTFFFFLNRKSSVKEPISAGVSQRSTLELHDVNFPVIPQDNPPSGVGTQNANEEQRKPMSTAVVLQRYWRLSVSCEQSKDNILFLLKSDLHF